MSAITASKSFRPDIEGLRALAVSDLMPLVGMRFRATHPWQRCDKRDGRMKLTCCVENGGDWQWDHEWKRSVEAAELI